MLMVVILINLSRFRWGFWEVTEWAVCVGVPWWAYKECHRVMEEMCASFVCLLPGPPVVAECSYVSAHTLWFPSSAIKLMGLTDLGVWASKSSFLPKMLLLGISVGVVKSQGIQLFLFLLFLSFVCVTSFTVEWVLHLNHNSIEGGFEVCFLLTLNSCLHACDLTGVCSVFRKCTLLNLFSFQIIKLKIGNNRPKADLLVS